MCYAVMNHVTDYDVWHISEEPVTMEMVIAVLLQNTELAQEAVRLLIKNLKPRNNCECDQALAAELITDRQAIPKETCQKLDLLVNKYLS